MLRKILIGVGVVLLVILTAGGFEAYRLYTGVQQIVGVYVPPHIRTKYDPKGALPTLTGDKRINILLLGTDNDNKGNPKLSQTMMVVTIDPLHKKVGMLSIPRDFWVWIPGVNTYAKIDAALSYGIAGQDGGKGGFAGGVALARTTVETNFKISIDYYAWVGLQGFVNVIKTFHGVVIDASHPIVDDNYPNDMTKGANPFSWTRVYIPPGPQYMDGQTALQYVRSRHADLIGDFGRGARQEQMLLGLRRKLNSMNTLTSIQQLSPLINDLSGFVKSDVGTGQLPAMVSFARSLNPTDIHRIVLSPPNYSSVTTEPDGESAVTPNWSAINPVVAQMFAPVSGSKYKPKIRHKYHPPSTTQVRFRLSKIMAVNTLAPPPKPPSPTPTFSPAPFRGHVYFVSNGNVWTYDGTSTARLTNTRDVSGASVTASGHLLVYARRWSPVVSDIFTLNLQSGQHGQITHDRTTDGIVQDNLWAFNPQISPTGKTILYSSDAYKLMSTMSTPPIDLALYSRNRATGSTTQVTYPAVGAGGDVDPHFNPVNQQQVVYTAYSYRNDESVLSQLTLLDLTTDQTTPLSPYSQNDSQPAWQPWGHRMAYVQSDGNAGSKIFIANFANDQLKTSRAKTVDYGMVSMPTYSPDGRHLAYFKLVGSDFQLWVADLHNGWPTGVRHQMFSMPNLDPASQIVWTW
jgi:LCP family protein required for cell wall assembly